MVHAESVRLTADSAIAARRLAVVVSHPIQYFSPWWAHLASQPDIEIKVFYLWDFGVEARHDRDFGMTIRWDTPLLDGYAYEFIENVSAQPGTHHFGGLHNPALVSKLAEWQPDVILMVGYAYRSHLRLLFSRIVSHVPIVLRGDSHNVGRPAGPRTTVTRLLRKLVFRRVKAFLAVGKANARYFMEVAGPRQRVFLAPHFVDNQRFRQTGTQFREEARAWRRQQGIPDDAIVFGFVGKLEEKKRPGDLLRASEHISPSVLPGAVQRAVTLFVGSGALLPDMVARAGQRVGRDVYFAPFQNQSAMPLVYAAIDILVLPSGYGETWGLCVNEAMNLGVPAIVSDVVGCGPDLVIPGVTGWVFRSGDVADLRKALIAAIDRTPEQKAAMAMATREHVAAYSVEAATAGLRDALGWVTRQARLARAR
jgi:glycosyltransferase involved in cell wall biosynthesis